MDGKWLAVTPTVSKFLWYRRSFFSQAYRWIDAVCIDQQNAFEKESQIPLMQQIYRKATRTIVWLAHASDVTDERSAQRFAMRIASFALNPTIVEEKLYALETSPDPDMPALISMLSRTFFGRLWVVQEIVLAKKVHIMYGDITMEWSSLASAAECLLDPRLAGAARQVSMAATRRVGQHLSNIRAINILRMVHSAGVQLTMGEALSGLLSFFRTTSPHDTIFGLLGMVSQSDALLGRPNYTETLQDLYARIARHIITHEALLGFLQLAGTGLRPPHTWPAFLGP